VRVVAATGRLLIMQPVARHDELGINRLRARSFVIRLQLARGRELGVITGTRTVAERRRCAARIRSGRVDHIEFRDLAHGDRGNGAEREHRTENRGQQIDIFGHGTLEVASITARKTLSEFFRLIGAFDDLRGALSETRRRAPVRLDDRGRTWMIHT
jgi:hypothetical protein